MQRDVHFWAGLDILGSNWGLRALTESQTVKTFCQNLGFWHPNLLNLTPPSWMSACVTFRKNNHVDMGKPAETHTPGRNDGGTWSEGVSAACPPRGRPPDRREDLLHACPVLNREEQVQTAVIQSTNLESRNNKHLTFYSCMILAPEEMNWKGQENKRPIIVQQKWTRCLRIDSVTTFLVMD